MFRRAWWQSSSRILEGRQGARKKEKKRKRKKIYFFVINEVAIHIFWHLMFDLLFFSVSRCDLTKKPALAHARFFNQITKNSGKLQWPDSNVVIWQKKRLRVQFLMSNDNLFSVKLQWAHARNLELQWCLNCAFFLHIVIWQKKFGKMQWADDANRFKHLNNQTTGILQNTSAVGFFYVSKCDLKDL